MKITEWINSNFTFSGEGTNNLGYWLSNSENDYLLYTFESLERKYEEVFGIHWTGYGWTFVNTDCD